MFQDLSDIGRIYQKTWFLRQICYAAATTNSVWGSRSNTALDYNMDYPEKDGYKKLLDFDYHDGEKGTEFAFSNSARKYLLDQRKVGNAEASDKCNYAAYGLLTDHNSSSGCPVNRRRAQISDPAEINMLANAYGVNPAEVTKLHPDTGIEFAMKELGKLITHAATLTTDISK